MPHQRGFAAWLMRHLPLAIAINPERVLINFACVLIGLSTILGERSTAMASLWPFPLYEWAAVMFVGGGSALYGTLRQERTPERLGMVLLALGCVFYGVLAIIEVGPRGVFTALIFFAIAGAKLIRLTVTSAIRAFRIQLAEAMKEEPSGTEPE